MSFKVTTNEQDQEPLEIEDDVEETIILEESAHENDKSKSTNVNTLFVQDCFEHEDPAAQVSSFDVLPEELVIEIFSFIPLKQLYTKLPLVCKSWKSFSWNPLLWQNLTFEDIKYVTTDCLIKLIRDRCSLLKNLSLKCRSEMHNFEFLTTSKLCPMLQKLSLSFCTQINVHSIRYFIDNCPKLQDINLEGCNIHHDCISVLCSLPYLTKINVSHCTHLEDESLIQITAKCLHLTAINFDGIQWITDEAIKVMVQNCWNNLECLWLDGANLSDDGIRLIARCQKLRIFSLSFCDELSDDALIWVQQMKRLHTLRLKKGVEFTAHALRDLFENLHYKQMTSRAGLCFLALVECLALDDEGVYAIATSCPSLITLDLSWCWDITDVGLEHIIQNCPRMQDLNICGLREVTGAPLQEVPSRMVHLTSLDARQCNTMRDELLEELVNKMPQITIMDYYGDFVLPNG